MHELFHWLFMDEYESRADKYIAYSHCYSHTHELICCLPHCRYLPALVQSCPKLFLGKKVLPGKANFLDCIHS